MYSSHFTKFESWRSSVDDLDNLKDFVKEMIQQTRLYQKLVDNMPDMVTRLDKELRHIYVNPEIEKITGRKASEILGKTWGEMGNAPEMYEPLRHNFQTVFETGQKVEYESEYETIHGTKYYRNILVPELGDGGAVETVIVLTRDITEQRQSEERFYKAFHANPSMMVIVSLEDEKVVDANESFVQTTGVSRDEFAGLTMSELGLWTDKAERAGYITEFHNRGRVRNYEMHYFAKSGELRTALVSADIIVLGNKPCRMSVFTDITQNKLMEAEIARLDRLNVIGEMAVSIGHEIRNPLTSVRGYLQLLQMKKEYAKDSEQFNLMIGELDRANSIISEFLTLAKNKRIKLKPTDLNAAIRNILPLLRADAVREGKDIQTEFTNIPQVLVDEDEIRQCIMNLVRNALEAAPEKGVVILSTDWNGQDTACISVKDDGPGIPLAVYQKLGTPFVTTKENGAGLGLPICYQIAERNNAKIEVKTSPAGTTFSLWFKILTS